MDFNSDEVNKVFQQNFKNWTSGNQNVDTFIQKVQLKTKHQYETLEWIEYDQFEGIEYMAKGRCGTIYKAFWENGPIKGFDSKNNQWKRETNIPVALKCFDNLQDVMTEFLKEIETHVILASSSYIVHCYGITKDPKTNNFMSVMEYAQLGDLRHYLNSNFNSLGWIQKLYNLFNIASGLMSIHEMGLIHRNFHSGNILNKMNSDGYHYSLITGLGLGEPANAINDGDNKIYGVLPYVAPEVLKGKEYTQASDVYGFGIIAYELCTGSPPYRNATHDEFLAINICQGLRPESDYKIPQLILDIIQQCWDPDPLKRPKTHELCDIFGDLWRKTDNKKNDYEENSLINQQIKEADEINIRSLLESTN